MNPTAVEDDRKRLLIIGRSQFGYHIDTYFYCKYLADLYQVTYLGWDYDRPRVSLEGITIRYVSRRGGKVRRFLRLIHRAGEELRRDHDHVLLKYFAGCSVIRALALGERMILDVRTARVTGHRMARRFYDALLRLEAKLFGNVTIISKSLANRLGLSAGKVHVLPLGADVISGSRKHFERLDCLYVGTLNNRNVEDTVRGFALFHDGADGELVRTYTIIGSGDHGEEQELAQIARTLGVGAHVSLLGPIPHQKLAPYFERCNVGVSFIPLTEYFDCQPPTKTFEYLLSGMPVIATRTTENRRVITDTNGLLIDDTAEGFASGLAEMVRRRNQLDSDQIREASLEFTWERIVLENLHPYLESL